MPTFLLHQLHLYQLLYRNISSRSANITRSLIVQDSYTTSGCQEAGGGRGPRLTFVWKEDDFSYPDYKIARQFIRVATARIAVSTLNIPLKVSK